MHDVAAYVARAFCRGVEAIITWYVRAEVGMMPEARRTNVAQNVIFMVVYGSRALLLITLAASKQAFQKGR